MAIAASQPEEQISAQPQAQTTLGNVKVATPLGFIALRIVQLIVALAILGLTAYLLYQDYGVPVPVTRFPHPTTCML